MEIEDIDGNVGGAGRWGLEPRKVKRGGKMNKGRKMRGGNSCNRRGGICW